MNVDKFEELLYNEYNYVYILKSDDYFSSNYYEIFNNTTVENWSLYKIEKNIDTQTITLCLVEY